MTWAHVEIGHIVGIVRDSSVWRNIALKKVANQKNTERSRGCSKLISTIGNPDNEGCVEIPMEHPSVLRPLAPNGRFHPDRECFTSYWILGQDHRVIRTDENVVATFLATPSHPSKHRMLH